MQTSCDVPTCVEDQVLGMLCRHGSFAEHQHRSGMGGRFRGPQARGSAAPASLSPRSGRGRHAEAHNNQHLHQPRAVPTAFAGSNGFFDAPHLSHIQADRGQVAPREHEIPLQLM